MSESQPGRAVWKRNLAILWIGEVLSIAGFSVVLPFLPYYVQELGITDTNQVAFWSGVLTSSQAVTMSFIAPIWGWLADRYGRKIMVSRAMFGGAVIMSLMGLVQNVQQLAILRAIQGLLTGTVPAAMTLVASGTPSHRRGFALGALQMAIYLGASTGPLLGGLVADQFGHRPTFFITGGLLLGAGILVTLFVREDFDPGETEQATKPSFWSGLEIVFASYALLIVFGLRMLVRMSFQLVAPVLPLFIQSISIAGTKIASLTGVIAGMTSAVSAAAAIFLGRLSDRIGPRKVVIACSIGAAMLYALQSRSQTTAQFIVTRVLSGVATGGIVASVAALQAKLVPKNRFGAVYGIDTSLVAGANAVAPMIGALLTTTWGMRSTFLGATLLYLVMIGLVAVLGSVIIPQEIEKPEPASVPD